MLFGCNGTRFFVDEEPNYLVVEAPWLAGSFGANRRERRRLCVLATSTSTMLNFLAPLPMRENPLACSGACCPGGTSDNSPRFQPWGPAPINPNSSEGTAELHPPSRFFRGNPTGSRYSSGGHRSPLRRSGWGLGHPLPTHPGPITLQWSSNTRACDSAPGGALSSPGAPASMPALRLSARLQLAPRRLVSPYNWPPSGSIVSTDESVAVT